ncbi:MAG: sigma 54-interacting transcriptional regulator [Hydrogenophaga sp.]|uniref:sigma-54 interaction domain-containing protein n=1 Tax=Hydrogenophaga sp. TaxID=1904254 RepID=UPI002625E5E4|nr:sigma-54-dependent Fis family transcriptional regulator [Hydrogenophaga sp.]MDD3784676.1 sigma 54-interacting transcriptional regulator [Hydrogenophaga sp.]
MKPLPELTAFLEGLPEPHILFDAQYRILASNAAYRRQFSPQRSVIGRHCYEVSHHFAVPCDHAGESCPLALSRQSGQRERVLHLHHTPRGEEYVNIELSPLPGEDGQPAFYVEKMEPLRVAHSQPDAPGLIGRSLPFQRMLALVARVAPSQASVLLLGESGTGKELVARAVHQASPRAGKALVAVDCSSLTETLFESELFGHERGAFTGATATKPGLVEAASGGTLFLDEVGDIPLPMQVKLLRLLETGTYRRVGSTELRHADIRVVAATHRDLDRMMADGRFREDLYYRLCTFPIALPPLREREGDIALLAPALLERVAAPRRLQLSASAMALLQVQPFPGNVRELRNLLERAALLCDGDVVDATHVEEAIATGRRPGRAPAAPPLPRSPAGTTDLRSLERDTLRALVAAHTGKRAELAARLGVSERTLYRKLRQLKLD